MEPSAGTGANGAVLSVEWEPADVEVHAQAQLRVQVMSRAEIQSSPAWTRAFAGQRKDRRYYELVEDTLRQGFDYRYFMLTGETGEVRAIQPFFLLDQDLLAGAGPRIAKLAEAIRRAWPRFLLMRTLMVGCAAGEGHLDGTISPIIESDYATVSEDTRIELLQGVLSDAKVALVTDGRMSGASGKIPAAIHVSPDLRLRSARRAAFGHWLARCIFGPAPGLGSAHAPGSVGAFRRVDADCAMLRRSGGAS